MNKKLTQNLIIATVFLLIDIAAIVSWVFYVDPDSSVTIYLIAAVPVVVFLNLAIGGIAYLFRKNFLKYFVINAAASSLILVIAFIAYIGKDQSRYYECWEFKLDGQKYSVSYEPTSKLGGYSVLKHHYNSSGGQWYRDGEVRVQNDTISFDSRDSTDEQRFFIHKDYLYNFRGVEKIRVKKVH